MPGRLLWASGGREQEELPLGGGWAEGEQPSAGLCGGGTSMGSGGPHSCRAVWLWGAWGVEGFMLAGLCGGGPQGVETLCLQGCGVGGHGEQRPSCLPGSAVGSRDPCACQSLW